MIWNKVFTTGDVSGYSNRTLCAIGLSGFKNYALSDLRPSHFEDGIIAIGNRLNCRPTREAFINYNVSINLRETFSALDLVKAIGGISIEHSVDKIYLLENYSGIEVFEAHYSIVDELITPVAEAWASGELDWNPLSFIGYYPTCYPIFYKFSEKYKKTFS
jgi:hypothetical protein